VCGVVVAASKPAGPSGDDMVWGRDDVGGEELLPAEGRASVIPTREVKAEAQKAAHTENLQMS